MGSIFFAQFWKTGGRADGQMNTYSGLSTSDPLIVYKGKSFNKYAYRCTQYVVRCTIFALGIAAATPQAEGRGVIAESPAQGPE